MKWILVLSVVLGTVMTPLSSSVLADPLTLIPPTIGCYQVDWTTQKFSIDLSLDVLHIAQTYDFAYESDHNTIIASGSMGSPGPNGQYVIATGLPINVQLVARSSSAGNNSSWSSPLTCYHSIPYSITFTCPPGQTNYDITMSWTPGDTFNSSELRRNATEYYTHTGTITPPDTYPSLAGRFTYTLYKNGGKPIRESVRCQPN